ncbi:RNA polymerase sigma factor [Eggerthellaceae bacterium 3-80]
MPKVDITDAVVGRDTITVGEGNMRSESDIEQALELHGDAVWRACVLHVSSCADAQDIYQDTFLRYALADEHVFTDDEHRKAWLLRVALNKCKDFNKAAARKCAPLNDLAATKPTEDPLVKPGSLAFEVVDAFCRMTDPPKTPAYLAICEGYTAPEISEMIDAPVNSVYTWISRGRAFLKEALL